MKWFLQQQRLSEDLYAVIFFPGIGEKTRSFKSDLYPYRLAKENASFTSPGLNFSPSVKWENNGSLAEPL